MKLQYTLFTLFFVLIKSVGFSQNDELKNQILGTWVAGVSTEDILFIRANEFEEENYGITFFEDGTLIRRSAKGMFDITWYNHPGKWSFDGTTLTLFYVFDEEQKAQEKLLIKHIDNQSLRLERLEWEEIRE